MCIVNDWRDMLQLNEVKQEFKFGHLCSPGTHQPVLFTICNRPNLKILEFGCGYFSSLLLHYMNTKLNHTIISMETDATWITNVLEQITPLPSHEFWLIEDWFVFLEEDKGDLQQQHWDVVFVDQAPWDARHVTIEKFKNIADYIVVHDSDMHPGFEFDYSPHLKYFEVYMPAKPYPYKSGPPTLLGSNYNECKFDINPEDFNQ